MRPGRLGRATAVGEGGTDDHVHPTTWKPLRCRLGLHHWHDTLEPRGRVSHDRVQRCGTSISKPHEIMARIGWVGHQNS